MVAACKAVTPNPLRTAVGALVQHAVGDDLATAALDDRRTIRRDACPVARMLGQSGVHTVILALLIILTGTHAGSPGSP